MREHRLSGSLLSILGTGRALLAICFYVLRHVWPKNCLSSETKAVFGSSVGGVGFTQHALSQGGRHE